MYFTQSRSHCNEPTDQNRGYLGLHEFRKKSSYHKVAVLLLGYNRSLDTSGWFPKCWTESRSSFPFTHLAAVGGDDAEVSGDPVSSFDLHQVSGHHLLRIDLHLLSLTDHQGLLGTEKERERERERGGERKMETEQICKAKWEHKLWE